MALKFASAALVILALVQDMNGVAAVNSAECNLKVQQLRSEISQSAGQAQLSVSLAASAISRNINSVRLNIKTEVQKVQLKADQAVGPNANVCRKNLKLQLALVNSQALNPCYNNIQINSLNQRVNQINSLKGDASQICSSCLDDSCVDAKVEEIGRQAGDLQAAISAEAEAVQEDSAQCAEAIQKSQLEIINNASASFDACIQNA